MPPDATPPPPPPPGIDSRDIVEECLLETADILIELRAASPSEINQAIYAVRDSHAAGQPAELLEALARIQGHSEEHIGKYILDLGNKVAQAQIPNPPLIPFAGKLIAPSAFYDSFDQLHDLGRMLLSPVIYAEDTDCIGTASVNPIAAAIMATEIGIAVHRRFGIRPFLTIARLDYESWTFLTRKHFGL